MEVGSHTISHTRAFRTFPLGDGAERYPDHVPFVRSKMVAGNGTILGELRVSRFLLEHLLPDTRVSSFRPGHLANPFALPQAQGDGVWYGSVEQFGGWWAARDMVAADVAEKGGRMVLSLAVPQPLQGLTLEIPEHLSLVSAPPGVSVQRLGTRLVPGRVAGRLELAFASHGRYPLSGKGLSR